MATLKKAKTIGKLSKTAFTGPSVSLLGMLKFGGPGPFGRLSEMTKKGLHMTLHSHLIYLLPEETMATTINVEVD